MQAPEIQKASQIATMILSTKFPQLLWNPVENCG
jgi:hypothetical protein